jgi:hypothetical protein
MKTKEKILEYVDKKPIGTAEEITEGLGTNHEIVIAYLG